MSDLVPMKDGGDIAHWRPAPAQTAKWSGLARHNRPAFDDYSIAQQHILQAIGDMSDFELFGCRVLIAVFCKPNIQKLRKADGSETMWITPVKDIKEDWWQGKSAMILTMGPDAFEGDESYHKSLTGDPTGALKPRVGDWVFANANAGTTTLLCGRNPSRPQGVDMQGNEIDIYEWDGWPCRVIDHDEIWGRNKNPQLLT